MVEGRIGQVAAPLPKRVDFCGKILGKSSVPAASFFLILGRRKES